MSSAAGRVPPALRVRTRDRDRAVLLSELDAVIECPPLASVPAAPEWLMGVGAYKGTLLSVVDLATACGAPRSAAPDPGARLLLVEIGAHRIAFSVEAILSQTAYSIPRDGSAIALRDIAARLLAAAPGGSSDSAGPD